MPVIKIEPCIYYKFEVELVDPKSKKTYTRITDSLTTASHMMAVNKYVNEHFGEKGYHWYDILDRKTKISDLNSEQYDIALKYAKEIYEVEYPKFLEFKRISRKK